MPRIFINPDAADGVADKLSDLDHELLTRAPRIETLLEQARVASRAPHDARRAAQACATLAKQLRTRAQLIRDADTQRLPHAVRELLTGNGPHEIHTTLTPKDPARVLDWWSTLPLHQQAWLKANAREAISGLDGIPIDIRDELNRQRINAQLSNLRAKRTSLGCPTTPQDRARLTTLYRLIAAHEAMLAPDLTILLYDPTGDGRAAVALGAITTATHIGIIVPGITNQLDNYPGMIGNARTLDTEARRQGSTDHAVIAWLGYNTPEISLTAAGKQRAQQGAGSLVPFVNGLRAVNTHGADVTVMGHSYGSLVTGIAAQQRMQADRIVLAGSPGTGARNVTELGMSREDVYVARVPDDPIQLVFTSGEAQNYLFGGPAGLLTSKAVGFDPDIHGPDPSLPKFGATPLPYDNKSQGHSEYYLEGGLSLKNHARVMLDRPVKTAEPEPVP